MTMQHVRRRLVPMGMLSVVLSLCLTTYASAQFSPTKRAEKRLTKMMEETLEEMALSEEKEALVRPIMEEGVERQVEVVRQAFADHGRGAREVIHSEMETVNKETAMLLAEVLSPEEMERYKTIRLAQAERNGRGRGN